MLLRCTKPRPPRFLGSWMFLVRFSNFRKRVSSFERALFTEGFRTLSRIVARTRGDHPGRLYLLRLRGCDVKSARMLRKGTTMGTKFRLFFLDRLEKPISLPFSFFTMEIINSTRMKFSTVKLLHQFFSLRRTVEIFNPVLIQRRTQKRFKFLEFSGNRRWSTRSEGKGDERKVFEGNFDRC